MHPWLVRHVVGPLHETLRGRRTYARLRELEGSQWWSQDALRQLQAHKLGELLRSAAQYCAYYRERFAVLRVDPDRDDPWDALKRLPLLDKRTVAARRDDLTHRGVPGGLMPYNTGGSTGEPVQFYLDRRRIAYDKAARMRTHRWFGAQPGDREVYLWGAPVELSRQDRLRSLRDHLTNELLLSAFNMSPRTMRDYLRRIEEFDPVSLFGYPSSLALLCGFARAEGIRVRPRSLKVVFATGEVLEPEQRSLIEDYFDAPVANGYGSREGGFLAHECPRGTMHIMSENVALEIVDQAGQPLPYGRLGEIVITHLDAYAMPFIRYRTGDLGRLLDHACPCGRGLQVMDVVAGRHTDHLVATDGTLKHALSLIYVLRDIEPIRQFQIRQNRNRDVEILVVAQPALGESERRRIDRGVRRHLGQGVRLTLRLVDSIELAPSGKHRHVISEAACGIADALASPAWHR